MAERKKKQRKPKREAPLIMRQGELMPWIFILPALIIVIIYIAYPTIYTAFLSLRNADSSTWATAACREGEACWGVFENYRYALTSDTMLRSFRNNILWLVVMVPGVTTVSLLVAVLVDRVKYEPYAKALIFMPYAISFVAAGVIWGFVYDFPVNPDNPNAPIIGLLNAIIVGLGGQPVPWLSSAPWINNFALIVVGIWMFTGFSMTILSAAIKGVPKELLEASRIDGATEWDVFWRILVPMILPTITVVLTTLTIFVLKQFDVIYIMTGGNFGTSVIGVSYYREMFVNFEAGRSAAIAIVLTILIIPMLYYNIRRFQDQEAIR
jgi:alpha-glucoside transport system permease protein